MKTGHKSLCFGPRFRRAPRGILNGLKYTENIHAKQGLFHEFGATMLTESGIGIVIQTTVGAMF